MTQPLPPDDEVFDAQVMADLADDAETEARYRRRLADRELHDAVERYIDNPDDPDAHLPGHEGLLDESWKASMEGRPVRYDGQIVSYEWSDEP